MKETTKLGLFLLFSGAIFISSALYASDIKSAYLKTPLKPMVFSPMQGKPWVEKCIEYHPEILWLADSNVRKTEEGQATLQGTYSEQLFNQKYIEFDRTIMTIQCLKLILNGSYEAYAAFTEAQPISQKLSRESFQAVHFQGKTLLESRWEGMSKMQMALAMETALVLGDIGKSEKARGFFKPYGISAPDHDDFYGEAIAVIERHPELSPSFLRLSYSGRKLLVKVANLAHYGHITHLEGGMSMFSKLKESAIPSTDPMALSFDLFIHICDVAGALGHVNNQSSLVYTEPAHQAMQAMAKAVQVLADPEKSEWDAYNAYLAVRAGWLGLSSEDHSDRVLARIGAMLRLYTPEEGFILKRAMLELDGLSQERVGAQLDIEQNAKPSRTPTYIPAVLVNLSNNLQWGMTKEERLFQAVKIGLPFIAKVLEKHKELLAEGAIDSNIPLNFNKIAGAAKNSNFPSIDFAIDKKGVVHVVSERGCEL